MTADALIEAVARGMLKLADLPENEFMIASYKRAARNALSAIEANGYRVVPVEPTPEMIKAASVPWGNEVNFTATEFGTYSPDQWSAMLSAAPKLTEPKE